MAYTKYSLTPADNNAAPPNGAPEGMLPSAVNDTMRDMMSQIRDVGDGIRGGTYTMTAPVITGGSINGTTVGATTASTGAFSTLSASGVATFSAGTVSAPAITTTGDTNTGIFFPAADTIAFTEGGAESMRIDNAGNLGVGTSSPNAAARATILSSGTSTSAFGNVGLRLSANGSGYASTLVFSDEVANSAGISMVSGNLAFGTSGFNTERMRIDSSGNVGIGTSSPAFKLEVKSTGSTTSQFERTDGTYVLQLKGSGTTATGALGMATNDMVVLTNGSERMRIDSAGTLFIGATSSPSGTQRLVLTANGGAGIEPMLFNELRTGSATENYVQFYRNGSNVGSISNTSVATIYNTTSDYRLKENVAPMTGALDKVSALKPVTYTWKLDGSSGQGFIAHELQAVIPDCVSGEKDGVDKDGKPKYQGIDTSFLVATLVSAIQELNAKVTALETQLGK
jgi:hypothetical protein